MSGSPSPRFELEIEVAANAARAGLGAADRVAVACSGGPDSVALAAAAAEAHRRGELGPVILAHVDHGLRPDSAADAEAVANLADALGLEFRLLRARVVRRGSLEAAARRARYRALGELARALELRAVLLAHTASDQAETVLMRIARGTGLRGLAGIPRRRGLYVRPLLDRPRSEIEAYLEARGITAVEDPTNRDPAHTRNRFRHRILPALREENPRLDAALCRLAESASEQREVLEFAAGALLERARSEDGPGHAAADLVRAPEPVAARALARAAEEATGRPLSATHIRDLLALCRDRGEGTRAVPIPGGRAYREYERVVFLADEACSERSLGAEEGAGSCRGGAEGEPEISVKGPGGPYLVRVWRPGDRMRPARLRGRSRKLSDLYIDAKVPKRIRDRARVVVREADGAIEWAEHLGAAHGAAVRVTLTPPDGLTSNRA